jgi:hypothetical protein
MVYENTVLETLISENCSKVTEYTEADKQVVDK